MNKRIRKKKLTQKRNASRKIILSMDEGIDKNIALMKHIILFGDCDFFHEVIGPGQYYIVLPRMNSNLLEKTMMRTVIRRYLI